MGTVPGSVVLSIGAVYFGEDGLGEEFYHVISRSHSEEMGLKESESTQQWWSKQSAEARKVVDASMAEDAPSLHDALNAFTKFVKKDTNVKVWGNGADFDNPLLACCYDVAELKQAWIAWNGRCYRTLKNIAPGPKLVRVGTYHNALDDAKSQALHAIELFKLHPTLVMA
jgi:hypothetical protein